MQRNLTNYNNFKTSNFNKSTLLVVLLIGGLTLTACVNDGTNNTLESAKVENTASSHEENHVAKKCTSGDRLRSSNTASNALTTVLTAYSEKEASLSEAARTSASAKLQEHAATLQQLDSSLNSDCRSYSACEFKASTNKQDCTSDKHKFLSSQKAMDKFATQLAKFKI